MANQSFPAAVGTTGSTTIASGATTLSMASVASLAVGQSVALNGATNSPAQAIAPGTVVSAVNASAVTITVSKPTVASLAASTKLYFGSSIPGSAETQRQTFNAFARANWNGGSTCTGLIDIDSIVADQGLSNEWRVDLGQASADGVHPSTVLHQAVINSGVLNPSRFMAP